MTRVYVAAPAAAFRLGLRALLEGPGVTVVGEGPAPDGAPADTDVLVIGDDVLAIPAGPPAAEGRAVVVLADEDGPAHVLRRLPLRGWAIVPREASGAELRAAVIGAAQGLVVFPARLAARLLTPRLAGHGTSLEPLPEPLTPREHEVLGLLAHGLSNRAIAERLGISEHTAKFHVGSVFGKLGASSRAEAVSAGARRGLITL